MPSAALLILALADPSGPPEPPEPPDPSQHRWRLHAEIAPLQLASSRSAGSLHSTVLMSIPGSTAIGFGRAVGRYVMIGTRLGGELRRHRGRFMQSNEPQDSRMVHGGGWLNPYVEVRPLPDRRVQPFGVVEGGVGLWGLRRRAVQGLVSQPQRSFQINPMVGGRVGLHAFVLPRLSVDADLGVLRDWSFVWRASPAMGPTDVDSQPLVLRTTGTLGLSGWW